jgi:hypothetical protein
LSKTPRQNGPGFFKAKHMNKKQQEEFLSKIPESNQEWVAQVILEMPANERHIIVHALRKLDKALYKSWAKDMTLNEIMEAVNIFSVERPKGTGALAD